MSISFNDIPPAVTNSSLKTPLPEIGIRHWQIFSESLRHCFLDKSPHCLPSSMSDVRTIEVHSRLGMSDDPFSLESGKGHTEDTIFFGEVEVNCHRKSPTCSTSPMDGAQWTKTSVLYFIVLNSRAAKAERRRAAGPDKP